MQYMFDVRRLSAERAFGLDRGDALSAFFDFVNGPEFLAFGAAVTGQAPVACEAQATRYRPGDLLTIHSDRDSNTRRLSAWVFNLTREWRPEWGGLLLFHDKDRLVEGIHPLFNSLSLFQVPMDHSVSQVTSLRAARPHGRLRLVPEAEGLMVFDRSARCEAGSRLADPQSRHRPGRRRARVSPRRAGCTCPTCWTPAAAERIRAQRSSAARLWARSTIVGGEVREFDLDFLARMPSAEQAAMRLDIRERARTGFQFHFDNFRLSDAALADARFGHDYEAVFDLLNGPEFLALARAITGDDRIAFIDAQTTRYRAGHFLTLHHDDKPGHDRLYAYVLGFTRDWRADWGGLLAFLGPDGHVEEAWTPAFNALNLFRVPTPHAVTQVADFAER